MNRCAREFSAKIPARAEGFGMADFSQKNRAGGVA
jgi:hypothetical protein